MVAMSDVEPPRRDPGIEPFKKYKLVPILFAFRSPECALPPICVQSLPTSRSGYRYRVQNGFHRYYASAAVGFPMVPVREI